MSLNGGSASSICNVLRRASRHRAGPGRWRLGRGHAAGGLRPDADRGLQIFRSRDVAIEDARKDVRNLSASSAQQEARSIEGIEPVLGNVVDRLEATPVGSAFPKCSDGSSRCPPSCATWRSPMFPSRAKDGLDPSHLESPSRPPPRSRRGRLHRSSKSTPRRVTHPAVPSARPRLPSIGLRPSRGRMWKHLEPLPARDIGTSAVVIGDRRGPGHDPAADRGSGAGTTPAQLRRSARPSAPFGRERMSSAACAYPSGILERSRSREPSRRTTLLRRSNGHRGERRRRRSTRRMTGA